MTDNKQIVRGCIEYARNEWMEYDTLEDGYEELSEALTALENLTDTAALTERLERMKKREFGKTGADIYAIPAHNAAIDAIIKELKGDG